MIPGASAADTTFHRAIALAAGSAATVVLWGVAAGISVADENDSRERVKSGQRAGVWCNSLIRKGRCGRSGSGPNGHPPTPLRKLRAGPTRPVAGSPSKNGKGFCPVFGRATR